MKKILLKLSGEALAGNKKQQFFDMSVIAKIANQISIIINNGFKIVIVVGGGNFIRGRSINNTINKIKADQIGMLCTIINCIYVSEIFNSFGINSIALTTFKCGKFTKTFSINKVNKYLKNNFVVLIGGGTGYSGITTDTTCILKAIEINADIVLLAKSIDGVYDCDPKKNINAKKYSKINIKDVINKRLLVIDITASILCMIYKIPVLIFNLNEKNSIVNNLYGKITGTKILV